MAFSFRVLPPASGGDADHLPGYLPERIDNWFLRLRRRWCLSLNLSLYDLIDSGRQSGSRLNFSARRGDSLSRPASRLLRLVGIDTERPCILLGPIRASLGCIRLGAQRTRILLGLVGIPLGLGYLELLPGRLVGALHA
ncbi:MAG TPA: hypothetical protein VMC81_10890 [Rhodocyclaceae bacterium]|nr:hypothetical protein [Rhodocyclaceae bacterium]